jgi:hypothetical protein
MPSGTSKNDKVSGEGNFFTKLFSKPQKEVSPPKQPRKKSASSRTPTEAGAASPSKKKKKTKVNDDENWLIQATELPTILK